MRTALSMVVSGHRVVGTAHLPSAPSGVALLLLNAGPLPRAWNSDLPCRVGDALAARGVATFRFDLPGLGDSAGDIAEVVEDFRRAVALGMYDEVIRGLGERLRVDFAAGRIAVGGLCAGAIESLRAVRAAPELFSGLILFEPDFRGEQAGASGAAGLAKANRPGWVRRRLGRTTIESARWLGGLRGPLVRMVSSLRAGRVPEGTDEALVGVWREVLSAGTPTLVLRAEHGLDWRTRRILQSLPAQRVRRSIRSVVVPGTNHMFNSGDGQALAMRAVVDWMTELAA